jgi:hypothetical protein
VVSPHNRLVQLASRIFDDAAIVADADIDTDGALPITVSGRFGDLKLRMTWAGNGWPSDVRRILEEYPQSWPSDLVVAAKRISPGSVELLEDANVSWADEAGNARIVAPGIFVVREQAPEPEARRAFSWSPSAIAIGEALLAKEWPMGVGTTELATLIQWSPPQVSQVLQAFDEQGWTIKYGPQRGSRARRELIDAEGLLDAWASAIASHQPDPRLAHRALRSPLAFLEQELTPSLSSHVRWALSGWAAAHELAPLADAVPSLQIYVHEDDFIGPLSRVIDEVGLSDVAEGGRVAFIPARASVLAIAQPSALAPIVSSPRVYADLLALGGRGGDAAAHLKEEVLDWVHPARTRRQAPQSLLAWERDSRARLGHLTEERPDLPDVYAGGTWSASYRLIGSPEAPDQRRFMAILREVAGHETGWPPWWIPESGSNRPHPVNGLIECRHADMAAGDPAGADFWRADPQGRLFLIRSYQEDSTRERLAPAPRESFDLTLPVWRTGECLLHAERLANRLEATGIQFMMRWTGIRGRKLQSLASPTRRMQPTRPAAQDDVTAFVEVTPLEVGEDLASVVRRLVDPLYASFDFFEPPAEIYEQELDSMRRNARAMRG